MLGDSIIQAMAATARPDAAKAFYQDTLGLKLIAEDQFRLAFAGKIGFLHIAKVPAVMPSAFTVAGFIVEDIEAAVAKLAEKGVGLQRFPFIQHDEKGVWTSPDGAKVAWFRDPDMNLLSLTQTP
jgi:catechol 2,3-dioxygenase-like lactoylglutathione lyase family enzyme